MTYEDIVFSWNAQADEYNTYDTLSDRERIEYVLSLYSECDDIFLIGVVDAMIAAEQECERLRAEREELEAHPPSRHCMCEECAPSFESTLDGLRSNTYD